MALRTVYEMAYFLVSFEGYVPVNMQHKFQQSVQMTVVCLAFSSSTELDIAVVQTVTGFLLVQTVKKTVVIRLCTSLARSFFPVFATTSAMVDSAVSWKCRFCSSSTVVDISTVTQRPLWCRSCSCGYGRRCVHAATVSSTVGCLRFRSSPEFVGVSLCSEMGTQPSAVVLWW